jgi:uncharacterized membrane protein
LLLRAAGIRELMTGVGILLQPRRPMRLWSRVVGDAIDLSLLGLAATRRRTKLPRLVTALGAVAGVSIVDLIAARRMQQAYLEANRPIVYAVTVNRPPAEVYAFWRDLERLPMFMSYLESVRVIDSVRSHWVARLPVGGKIAWDAEITEDEPGELLAWQSVRGAPVRVAGRVTFAKAPGRDATEVRVEMGLGFLGTKPSTALAEFFVKPQIKGDLRRFKQVVETGEVLLSDASRHRRPHPARPEAEPPPPPQVQFVQPILKVEKGAMQ